MNIERKIHQITVNCQGEDQMLGLAWVMGWMLSAGAGAVLLFGGQARAWETDQFTTPQGPLVDIAPQFQQHLTAVLQGVVAKANAGYLDASAARTTGPAT